MKELTQQELDQIFFSQLEQRGINLKSLKSSLEKDLKDYPQAIQSTIVPEPNELSTQFVLFGDMESVSNLRSGYQNANVGVISDSSATKLRDSGDHLGAAEEWAKAGESFTKSAMHLEKAAKYLVVSAKEFVVDAAVSTRNSIAETVNVAVDLTLKSANKASDKAVEMFENAQNSVYKFFNAVKNKITNSVDSLKNSANQKIESAQDRAAFMANNLDAKVNERVTAIEFRVNKGMTAAQEIKAKIEDTMHNTQVNLIAAGKTFATLAEPGVEGIKAAGKSAIGSVVGAAAKLGENISKSVHATVDEVAFVFNENKKQVQESSKMKI